MTNNLPEHDADPYVLFRLYLGENKRHSLEVRLVKTGNGWWETHCSRLPLKYRGRGYAVNLYSFVIDYALKLGYDVGSSFKRSTSANYIWRSRYLADRYIIKWNGHRYKVLNRQQRRL